MSYLGGNGVKSLDIRPREGLLCFLFFKWDYVWLSVLSFCGYSVLKKKSNVVETIVPLWCGCGFFILTLVLLFVF